MRVAGIQHDIHWEDPRRNVDRLAEPIAKAAQDGAQLVALTEMFSTGFSMNTEEVAESTDGPSGSFLSAQAREHGLWVCGSIPQRSDTRSTEAQLAPVNRLVLAGPGGELHTYAKRHTFSFAGEHRHYRAGDKTLTVTINGVRTSFLICYDLRFAPDFWDLATRTDLYVVVANWPATRREHWRTLLRARAIENQAYVLGVNRVGTGGGVDYAGDSVLLDPLGDAVADADGGIETIVAGEIDPARVAEVRQRFPFLNDRR